MTIAVSVLAVAVAALVAGLRRYLAIVTVSGTSMEPTYRPGDQLLARRPGRRGIRRGDVIVLRTAAPTDKLRPGDWVLPPNGRLIKRVTAVPGDTVPRNHLPPSIADRDTVIPPRRFVVLGDNPAVSADSRMYGYFTEEQIIGVIVRPVMARPDRRRAGRSRPESRRACRPGSPRAPA